MRDFEEEKFKRKARVWHEKIREHTEQVAQCQMQSTELAKQIAAAKSERDHKYRALVSKLHKQHEVNNQAARRLAQKQHELEEVKQGHAREVSNLEETVYSFMLFFF